MERGSLAEIPFDNAREAPGELVLSRKDAEGVWRDVSAAEFAAEVLAVAKGLMAEGLRAGDRVAIMARTTYEWTLLDFAAWAAGLVTVPIYPTSSAFQARWILQNSGAVACAVETKEQGRLISQERKQLGDLAHLWQFDTGAIGHLKSLGKDIPDAAVAARRATLEPHSPATLIYTSGTTGRPKGCVLTHGNFFAEVDNAIELLHPVFKSVSKDPASTLLFLPLSHVFGRMVAIGCMRARVRLGHAPSIQTEDLLADLAGFRPTFLLAIPYVLEKVYNTGRATAEKMGRASSFDRAARIAQRYGKAVEAAEHGTSPGPGLGLRAARALYDPLVYRRIRDRAGRKVRYVICGGSPLGRRLAAFYEGAGIGIFEGYGLTETTAAHTVTPAPQTPPGHGGLAAARRLGAHRGRRRGAAEGRPGVPGLLGRGAGGGDPGAAGGRLVPDGRPGGAGRGRLPDDHGPQEGHHHHVGRQERHPRPLEDWLRAHPLVSQCMVVGDNRSYVTALITLEPDGLQHWRQMTKKQDIPMRDLVRDEDLRTSLQKAVDEANRLVSRAESIRRFTVLPVDFTEENGHLTPSLKLKRDAIARDFAGEIEGLYRK